MIREQAIPPVGWHCLPDLPDKIGVAGAFAGVSDGCLLVAGGANFLDKKDAAWREIQPLPGRPRFLSAAAAHNGSFFVVGGVSLDPCPDGKMRRSYLKEIWSYRPDNGWIPHASMLKPAVAAPTPAPVIDGHLLVLGGDDGSLAGFQPLAKHPGFTKSIQSYDIATNGWSQRDELPAGHAVLPCVLWQGLIVLVSGEQRPGVRTPSILARRQVSQALGPTHSVSCGQDKTGLLPSVVGPCWR